MRVAPRLFNWIGSTALVFALLLASPGVRVSQADGGSNAGEANFSWDPSLERSEVAEAPAPRMGRSPAVVPPPGTCAAQNAAPLVLPSDRAIRGLQGMPLLIAEGDEELNSLNGRGYNIGKAEPSGELQKLMVEIRRRNN